MSPLKRQGIERPQDFLRSSFHILAEDVRRLLPAVLAVSIYAILTHILFDRFCPMLILTGLPCPGCGMTRALFLVLRGSFQKAWELQPLIYGWILLGGAYGIRRYLFYKAKWTMREKRIWTAVFALLLSGSLFLYTYRILRGFPLDVREEGRTLWELIGILTDRY